MGWPVFPEGHAGDSRKIEPLVSDYRMNLVQVRSSGKLCFSDPDVNMVFDMSRLIYARIMRRSKKSTVTMISRQIWAL